MGGFTIVNVREVEDSAAAYGLAPQMSARFATKPLGGERLGLSLQRLAADEAQPFAHRHDRDEEIYVVLAGGGTVTLDGVEHELRPWDAVRVAPATVRRFSAGPDGLEFLAFGWTSGTADVENLPVGD